MQPREILSLLPPPEKLPTQNETHPSTGHPTHCDGYLCVRILQANDQCPLPYRLKTERRTVSVHCGCFRVARRTGLLRLFDQPPGPRCNCCSCNSPSVTCFSYFFDKILPTNPGHLFVGAASHHRVSHMRNANKMPLIPGQCRYQMRL